MIIVRLYGGMGNQMFQYALGRHLSVIHNKPLLLDLDELNTPMFGNTHWKYVLDNFNISAEIASREQLARFLFLKNRKILKFCRRVKSRLPIYFGTYIKEKQYDFDKSLLELKMKKESWYLDGYWQSPQYFSSIREIILKDLSIKSTLDKTDLEVLKQIQASNAISIHIRRGDYLSNPNSQKEHLVCSLDYYYKALQIITKHTNSPHLFIFSDDPKWVKENFKTDMPFKIVNHNSIDRAYADIFLMSKCSHHILANSSFSWWGAWMASNPKKQVICPCNWFNSINTKDLIPDSWHTV